MDAFVETNGIRLHYLDSQRGRTDAASLYMASPPTPTSSTGSSLQG